MATKKRAVPKKVKKSYHHGDLKTALKRATLRLVLEKGPRGFSLNEASRLAGVTVAAPYRHFEGKDALLADIATDGFVRLANDLREAASGVAYTSERLAQAGLTYLRFADRHPDYFAVMFGAGLDKLRYPELAKSSREAFITLRSLTSEMERDQAEATRQAITCWAFVHGLAALHADGAFSADDNTDRAIDTTSLLSKFIKKF